MTTADVAFLEDRLRERAAARAWIDDEIERVENVAGIVLDDAERRLLRRTLRPGVDGNFAETSELLAALRDYFRRPAGRMTSLDRFWSVLTAGRDEAFSSPAGHRGGDTA